MAFENFQRARHSIVSVIWPTMVGPGERSFKIKVLKRLENAILRLLFANAVNTSVLLYVFSTAIKHYVPFNSSTII